jgi:hypothetical protein
MDVAVPMVMIQHYLNPCLHYLIGPAMVTLIMLRLDDAVEISRGRCLKRDIMRQNSPPLQADVRKAQLSC